MNTKLVVDQVDMVVGSGNNETTILHEVSLSVAPGEFVAITGPSGSGKSTLLSIAGTLLTPSSGRIMLNGTDITQLSSKERASLRLHSIGFVFQSAHLLPYLNLTEQLLYIGKIAGSTKTASEKRTHELLSMLGLEHRLQHYPAQLSGGERQRAAIARAMMNDPEVLLADEPTASLDASRGREIVQTLAEQVKQSQKAAVMITHDTRLFDLCDRVITMEDGRVTAEEHPASFSL